MQYLPTVEDDGGLGHALEAAREEQIAQERQRHQMQRSKERQEAARRAQLVKAGRDFVRRVRTLEIPTEDVSFYVRTHERRRLLGESKFDHIYEKRRAWVVSRYSPTNNWGVGGSAGIYVLEDGTILEGDISAPPVTYSSPGRPPTLPSPLYEEATIPDVILPHLAKFLVKREKRATPAAESD